MAGQPRGHYLGMIVLCIGICWGLISTDHRLYHGGTQVVRCEGLKAAKHGMVTKV